jgi:hypothetical protein
MASCRHGLSRGMQQHHERRQLEKTRRRAGSNHKAPGFKYKVLWLESYYCSWSFDENSEKLLCPRSFISDPWLRQNRRHFDITRGSFLTSRLGGRGGGSIRKLHWSYCMEAIKLEKSSASAHFVCTKQNTNHWDSMVHFRKIMKKIWIKFGSFGFQVRL